MSTKICSRHLRILKLLKFTRGRNLETIEKILNISSQNLNYYLKDIYNFVDCNKKHTKRELIVNEILKSTELFQTLKNIQSISKEERIFFTILSILIYRQINLDNLSKKLDITRRSLNNDLDEIKELFIKFDLTLNSFSGRGVFLFGEHLDRKRALLSYLYKFLVEIDYLPKVFFKSFSFLFENEEIDIHLNRDIEKLFHLSSFDTFFKSRELLKAFYIAFKYLDDNQNNYVNSLSVRLKDFSTFNLYFSKSFSNNILTDCYNILQNSTFKDIDFDDISTFITTLNICLGNFNFSEEFLSKDKPFWKECISKNLNINLTDENFNRFKKIISKVTFISNYQYAVNIHDFSIFDFNLDRKFIDRCFNLYFDLRQFYPHLSFSDVITIFFTLDIFNENKKDVVIIFNEIPKHIISNLKETLELKYNIHITDIVSRYHFDEYKKNNPVKTVGTFTELDFYDKNLEILKLSLHV